jgi:Tol biopolymer transport system component
VDNCYPPPDLELVGECDEATGLVTFTVTNNGGPMDGTTDWETSDGQSGELQLGKGASVSFVVTPDDNGSATFNIPGYELSATVEDCYAPPDLTVVGECDEATGLVTFTVTNNGGPMQAAAEWEASDGQNGELQLGKGASVQFTITPDKDGTATFNIPDYEASATVEECFPPPVIELVGECDLDSLTVTFTVTNTGGPMDGPMAWTASDGQSGEFGPLGAGGSASFAVKPDAAGVATFNIPSLEMSETIEDCLKPEQPRLRLVGECQPGSGAVVFTVTNVGAPMTAATAWTASDGQSGDLGPLGTGESVEFTVIPDANGDATFDVAEYDVSATVEDCFPPPPPPALTLDGVCDTTTYNVVFTITNIGGLMSGPAAWSASDGQSGQFGPLAAGEAVEVVVQPDANGAATLNVPDFNLTKTVEGCVPPPLVCGATSETGDWNFPVVDMNPALCGPALSSGPWTPIEIGGAVCPDWFVYHTNQTGDWEIFRLGEIPGREGANPNLSQGVGPRVYDVAPSRSPDGEWITFASNRDGNWEIYVGKTDGTFQQRVTYAIEAIDIDPVWSPFGNYIAYESARDGNWELYLVDVATGAETRLTNDPGNDLNPFWSPDGWKLVFQSDREGFWQIYELNIATLEVKKLSDGIGDDLDPQYSNKGDKIAFRSLRDGDNGVLYVMNADGTDVQRISDINGDASNHVFSPDDTLIAYQSDLDGDLDIYVYEFASQKTRLVTDNTISDYAPTWWCSAPIIIFTSDITDDSNIFDTPALPIEAPAIKVEEEANQLTDQPEADQYPQNSPPEENASRQGALPRPAKNK